MPEFEFPSRVLTTEELLDVKARVFAGAVVGGRHLCQLPKTPQIETFLQGLRSIIKHTCNDLVYDTEGEVNLPGMNIVREICQAYNEPPY